MGDPRPGHHEDARDRPAFRRASPKHERREISSQTPASGRFIDLQGVGPRHHRRGREERLPRVRHLSLLLVLRRAFVALACAPSRRALKSDRMVLTAFAQVESERKESEKRAHKKRMFEAEAANANKKQAVDLAVARLRVQGAANAAAGFQASYAGASTSASASHMET